MLDKRKKFWRQFLSNATITQLTEESKVKIALRVYLPTKTKFTSIFVKWTSVLFLWVLNLNDKNLKL